MRASLPGWGLAAWLVAASTPGAEGAWQDVPRGQVLERVVVADDPEQTYALYLPSDYSPDRAWSVLLAFHPGARGVALVHTYRAAAERYGYIVAGSNNSRNGSWDDSRRAVRALSRDVGRRFTIDAERVYLTGHSGGARVALEVALGSKAIAGVIASSAGFPDTRPRRSVGFPVFVTSGIDDFNLLELTRLDRALTSPHALAIFDGGHVLPPEPVAREAIEWLELQAMRDGRRSKDETLVKALFSARQGRIDAAVDPLSRLRLTQAALADFAGLRDVAPLEASARRLAADSSVRRAIERERAEFDAEARLLDEALEAEARLGEAGSRSAALDRLRVMLEGWSRAAQAEGPSAARSRARRLLGAVAAGAADRVSDEEYRALVQQHRWPTRSP